MKPEQGVVSFDDLSAFDAADEADMQVVVNGKVTSWVWTFAGPGHPKTVEQSQRLARARLDSEREKEQARVNGRKWKAPVETVDSVRAENVAWVVDRLLRWSPVSIAGKDYPFSHEAATALLIDPRKNALLVQAMEFLAADTSFTTASATN